VAVATATRNLARRFISGVKLLFYPEKSAL
jgi:hypothetical protein